jgi:hypothetical protein
MGANLLFNNPALIVKLLIFSTIGTAELSVYCAAFYLTTSRTASSASGCLFVLSPFFLSTLSLGQLHVLLPFSLLPFLVPLYSYTMRKPRFREMFFLSVFCALVVFVGRLDIVKFLGLLLVSLISSDLLSNPIRTWPKHALRLAKFSVILAGTLALVFLSDMALFVSAATPSFAQGLKSYETLPVFLGDTPDIFRAILALYQGGYYSTLWGITFDRHPFLSQQAFFLVMGIVPVVAFTAVLVDKRKTTYALSLLGVLSAFMAKGLNPPLGIVTNWLYYSVPFGYAIVRGALLWTGLTTLSYSILAALTVNAVIRWSKGRASTIRSTAVNRALSGKRGGKLHLKFTSLRAWFLPATLLTILAVGPTLGSSYSLSSGLQVWKIPSNISSAYDWISSQSGEFRVASFPWQQSYMFVSSNGLNSGWWQGDVGNTLGYALDGKYMWSQSYFFSDAGYDLQSYFTEQILNNSTRDLPKMLGIYGVKYFIDNGYHATALGSPLTLLDQSSIDYESRFLAAQNGLDPVYSDGTARVFENKYWVPLIFIPQGNMLVVGGKDTLGSLAQIQGFDFRQWALLFAGQVAATGGGAELQSALTRADAIVFKDSSLTDLSVLLARGDGIWLEPSGIILQGSTASAGSWTLNSAYSQLGLMTLSPSMASAYGDASLRIPFRATQPGQYDVWVRLALGADRGTLDVGINGQTVGNVTPISSQPNVRWVNVGQATLTGIDNTVELSNSKSLFGMANDIDNVFLIKPMKMEQVTVSLLNTLASSNSRVIFLDGPTSGSDWLSEFSSSGTLVGTLPLLDGDLIKAWRTTDQSHVTLSPGEIPPFGDKMPSSARISLLSGRTAYAMIETANKTDLSNYDNLLIAIRGHGSNDVIGISFLFGNSYANEATFNLLDSSSEWRFVTFPLAHPSSRKGDVDWSKVWEVQIASGSKQSQGNLSLALLATSQANKTFVLELPRNGNYAFAPQASNTSYPLYVDGRQLLTGSEMVMQEGPHVFTVPYRTLVSDGLLTYTTQQKGSPRFIQEAFASIMPQAYIVSYASVSPTSLTVRVNATGPFTIVMSDNFHPLWRATLASNSFAPLISYGSMLSFYIPAKGLLDLTLKFVPQNYIMVTGSISMSTLALLLGVVIVRSQRRRTRQL